VPTHSYSMHAMRFLTDRMISRHDRIHKTMLWAGTRPLCLCCQCLSPEQVTHTVDLGVGRRRTQSLCLFFPSPSLSASRGPALS
jgi:hypothetical protein